MSDVTTRRIAVCVAGINADYNDALLRSFHSLADSFGYKLLIFYSFSSLYSLEKHDSGESHIFSLINYREIDALILLAETVKEEVVRGKVVGRAKRYGIPVVSVGYPIEDSYSIVFQHRGAMEEIVTHLIEKHHYHKINFIAGLPGNKISDERLDAYKSVLGRHGIAVEEERIGYGGFWSVPTKKVIKKFIESSLPFPEAIVCASDSMAVAACGYLTQAGYRVPEDVAVTGFDGIPEALEHIPSITTAKRDYRKVALQAFQMLEAYFLGKDIPEQSKVDSVFVRGASCGCEDNGSTRHGLLVRELYGRLNDYDRFNREQIAMMADLADNNSFQGVFYKLMKYADNFCADKFWLCIVDDFLGQKGVLADILEENAVRRGGYSGTMDVMLSRLNGEWQGSTDFSTADLLPDLGTVFEEENNVMFLPLHVLEQTIGYVALVYDPDKMCMSYTYQFCMNISTALETTRTHQLQQAVIDNLENKYIHDPMTGLFNRRGFYQCVAGVYKTCVEKGKILMVVSVDLNGLKPINDTYGHADGDNAILAVGTALEEASHDRFACARFGGDEFVVAGQVEHEEEAGIFCRDVAGHLAVFNAQSGKPYEVTASIGYVTGIPSGGITLDEFIKAADELMYEDKVRYHSRNDVRK